MQLWPLFQLMQPTRISSKQNYWNWEEEKLMWKDWAEGEKDRIIARLYNLQQTLIQYLGDEKRPENVY